MADIEKPSQGDKPAPDKQPDTRSQPDTTGIQKWLAEHPDDHRADAVRQKLTSMGVKIEGEQPGVMGYVGDRLGAFVQGTLLDPLEKVGQMAEHAPGWLGRTSRSIGAMTPQSVQDYLDEHRKMGERHPGYRLGGNLAGAFALPVSKAKDAAGVVADVATGAAGGVMQPLDPNDPNYWRDVGLQAGLGGTLGGGLGAVARSIAAKATDASRAALNVFQRVYNEMGLGQYAPKEINPQTAVQVRNTVGKRLGEIYQHMSFNPLDPAWRAQANQVYHDVLNAIADPALRQRWQSVFANEAARPAFMADPAQVGARVTGDKLHQVVSSLSGEASAFGQQAARGGADAKVWNLMSNGLRQLTQTIEGQIDRAVHPAIGAARRGAARAYQLAEGMMRASNAGNRWIPDAGRIASTLEQKFGKSQYAGPRFGGVKRMLESERDKAAAARAKPGVAARLGGHAVRIPGMIAGYEVGKMIGHPLAGALAGGEAAHAAARALPGAAARAGRYPGVTGAVAGQGVRGEELLVTPRGARWRPEQEDK